MKTGQLGIQLIKEFESLKLKQYYCSANVSTIGYGTTLIDGKPIPKGLVITQIQAEKYLADDLVQFENSVNKLVTIILTQNEFDALVCFTYNVGSNNLKNSTLLKLINKGTTDETIIKNEFLKWNKAKGVVLNGLTRRRKAESELFYK